VVFLGRLSVWSDRPNSGLSQVENFNHILEKRSLVIALR
jgi:hypothetical protein